MNPINPKKLLNSKWTALNPKSKEKHFIVTKLKIENDKIVECVLEAIYTKRSELINWQSLKSTENWAQGWK